MVIAYFLVKVAPRSSRSRLKEVNGESRGHPISQVRGRFFIFKPRHEISNNEVCATSKGSDQPAHTCSLIRAFAGRLNIL